MVSGESRERRGNTLRKVPVALWRMVCKCFVKSSLESNRRSRYFTVLDQGMVTNSLVRCDNNMEHTEILRAERRVY
jgi:hypothetical protein